MMYFENFSPGTSFEAGWTPRERAPGRRRVLQRPFGRLQEALWLFQTALGRLQEVLERFWAENIDFSLVFEGFGGVIGLTRTAGRLGWDPLNKHFLKKTVKP